MLMKMEVVVPMSPMRDFRFDNVPGSLNVTAPSTPKFSGDHLDYIYQQHASAPASPTRAAAIYAHFADLNQMEWDEDYTKDVHRDGEAQLAFDFAFSGPLEKGKVAPELATADELFESGMIRPLKPPPVQNRVDSEKAAGRDRGRERAPSTYPSSSSGSRRVSRSLSPLRGDGVLIDKTPPSSSSTSASSTDVSSCIKSTGSGSKRWRMMRDLLLFRSASEGRATGKGSRDPLRKYTFRSSMNASRTASAHEIHYTANRAASEEQKKKTALPYGSHGLFGYLRFNPAVKSISRGFNSSLFSRGRT